MVVGAYTIFFNAANNGIEFGRGFNVVNTQATLLVTSVPVSAAHESNGLIRNNVFR